MECVSAWLHYEGSDFVEVEVAKRGGLLICLCAYIIVGWGQGGGDQPPGIAVATGALWSGMTAQSGHVKSVRSTTDVSHDGWPNLPDVRLPGGTRESDNPKRKKKKKTCSLQAADLTLWLLRGLCFVVWMRKSPVWSHTRPKTRPNHTDILLILKL